MHLSRVKAPSKVFQAATLLICIREVLSSNTGRGTGYPEESFQ
jgi:hypothetical protein